MNNLPELPEHGKCIFLEKKKTIWRIYRHPDKILDNLAIVQKTVDKKSNNRWIVSKDYLDWVKSLIEHGYSCTIESNIS